eukprot:gene6105-7072_t
MSTATAQSTKPAPAEMSIPIVEMEGVTEEYKTMMEKAETEDFSDIAQLECFIPVGVDEQEAPVFLILGERLPITKAGLDKLLMYICKTLEPIVTGRHYTLLYAHTLIKPESTPDRTWLLNTYQMIPRNFKKNLKHFYIIHPTTWLRVLFMAMSPFLSEKTWRTKIQYIDYLQEIPDDLDRNLINSMIPDSVRDYDDKLLEEPEVAEKVMSSMETLGREMLSSFASPFNIFSSVDPGRWSSTTKFDDDDK